MTYISQGMRKMVVERANNCCEYCLTNQDDRLFPFAVDHIIAEKHRGASILENLCWSCYICNSHKGSDIGSIDWDHTEILTPLFHPCRQLWQDHFQVEQETALIKPLTAEGRVTVFLLRLNSEEQLMTRHILIRLGRYPCNKGE